MDFTNKRVLVTGGARGIGRAIARAFADRGARVAVGYRDNEAAAQETLRSLAGGGHVALGGDLADAGTARRVVESAVEALGGLDVLVNCAGIGVHHPLDAVDYEAWQAAWQRILAVNLVAPANTSYVAARHMMAHGGGRIVNVGSRGAFRGEPDQPAYGASKAGLHAMSQSLAQHLAPHGIGVGVVAPGFVETAMASSRLEGPGGDAIRAQSPLGRVARPEEVAHAVLFLASEEAFFSTGAIIDVNGASYLRG
ncbi:MAG TPA: SDR family oxidoreductase [Trueperaceae bacterium]|nr:SDR family oxidoreductase [Trueperaceae bacterium]